MEILYRAHFGRTIGKNGYVTDEVLKSFLRDNVSPRFKGFTFIPVNGYWEGNPESSFILEFITSADKGPLVQTISEEYCEQFSQDAVLWYATEAKNVTFANANAKEMVAA